LNTLTRATHQKITEIPCSGNLFSPIPDTDFRDYLEEVDDLTRFAPEIVAKHRLLGKNMRSPKRVSPGVSKLFRGFYLCQTYMFLIVHPTFVF